MLTGMRSRFLLSFLSAFSVAVCLPVQAQVNGVPPSVTSIGFGNSSPMFGNCCTNFFWPANPNPPL